MLFVTKYGDLYPLSNWRPSTTSRYVSPVLDSSIWTTPSFPTFSIALEISLPTFGSLFAEIVAICSNWDSEEILSTLDLSSLKTSSTALSIPRLISTAFAPSFNRCTPFFTNSRASNVEVVVPSPALSEVLIAAC